ncbi:hypothetical protein PHJA_000140400 [Phtheirospermum japonicum]|uniref:GTD-binding domain-containing protein n=1 Tax=Phtheirospermum japonicum TaxID=374723 RepID=A0A830AYN4_9LAMI|nr:hypothetical protein PHJA_000140400 [Phtheirospermum japonicum]
MPVRPFKSVLEQKLGKFPQLLIYAVLEWVMIILLFIDGLLAFVSNEFANYFDLRIPCLLCTRIDHVLVQRNSSFYYNDSICETHKKGISSLAYCHAHRKLSDIRSMCQSCLLSFATEKDCDCERYKSLVGMLHKDAECLAKKDDYKEMLKCSCCGETLKSKASSRYVRNLSMSMPAPSPSPSPRAAFLASRNEEGRNVESPRFRYPEVRQISDSNKYEVLEDDAYQGKEDAKALDSKDTNDDAIRTPRFARANKILGLPLNSAPVSPKWVNRGIRKLSLDKGEFIIEPIDANSLTEVENDILNRLKRQVHLDHNSLMELYTELDEERNASNVAANNAMAMITRLQAEKAAVQMEALQYQRMMEEQAEYDEEAFQSELDMYREKYGLIEKDGGEFCEVDHDEYYGERKSHSFPSFGEESDFSSFNGGDQNESERAYERYMENGRENQDEFSIGNNNKVTLTREVSSIKERLRAVEADSGFLKHAAMTLQKGNEGTKLLTEIAQHLRKIRQAMKSPSDNNIEA